MRGLFCTGCARTNEADDARVFRGVTESIAHRVRACSTSFQAAVADNAELALFGDGPSAINNAR
jgi:hypothetical protein